MVWAHTYPEWWSTYCQGKCKKKMMISLSKVMHVASRYVGRGTSEYDWAEKSAMNKKNDYFSGKKHESRKSFSRNFSLFRSSGIRGILRIRDMILSEKWDLGKNTVLCIWLCNLHTAEYLLVIHLHSDKWISFLVTCAYKLITARPPARNPLLVYFFRWFCMRLNLSVNLIRIFH